MQIIVGALAFGMLNFLTSLSLIVFNDERAPADAAVFDVIAAVRFACSPSRRGDRCAGLILAGRCGSQSLDAPAGASDIGRRRCGEQARMFSSWRQRYQTTLDRWMRDHLEGRRSSLPG